MCVLCVSRIGIGSILSIAIIILKINNDTFTVSYCCWLHECITLLPCQHMIITLDTHGKKKNGTECPSVWYKYNPTAQNCQCIPFTSLTCDGDYVYHYADIFITCWHTMLMKE